MIGNAREIIEWLFNQDKEKLYDIKEHKERRSLNANAYAWVLIGKIADVLRTDKDSVYLAMLKKYGQSDLISVQAHIDVKGYFKYYEEFGRASLQGKEFIHYRVFKGSSEYDSKEMAVLIDGIISDAQELGIETLPPHEIERLKNIWKNGNS